MNALRREKGQPARVGAPERLCGTNDLKMIVPIKDELPSGKRCRSNPAKAVLIDLAAEDL
ncbi:MAG: hypothetical protein JW950_08280 [Deltaproteobacteria bacterium]|nr:hypothetical protein [Deltaproteobacteria bacterium]